MTTQKLTVEKVIEMWCKGTQYNYIENPEVFKRTYESRIKQEDASFDLPAATIGFGIFDVGEISTPRNEENGLVFYVETAGVPRKVICSYPLDPVDPHYSCQILKYKK